MLSTNYITFDDIYFKNTNLFSVIKCNSLPPPQALLVGEEVNICGKKIFYLVFCILYFIFITIIYVILITVKKS